MSNNKYFWLVCGIGIGVFATIWWMQQRTFALALASHDNRIATLEYKSEQRAIADQPPKDKFKWYAGMLTLAGAAAKLIFMLVQHFKF